ncbi:protoporphyrinogen oxidase HemJ [Hydrocarboniclastica marina]|uniref:Protoporphyrinogen IX oxidase n=1 Tax=Hydrocarboniclastica marina TaxID=2259620 RepID=A0A4P7XDG7_9ALTE|nr:protoporphyrinogen oxidase HemJ [Hydrocarboniclastica marina]MAL99978.1 TIGR00701 family protein [Alteromonadaceae bacterium]QCF24929.1 protoporphyrinogen oxidase HemJ [Hydrocarboniclastica marina]|tara:strand:+ start:1149 stop:1571 length:423 start_codon:yes stop_codon:yes gene_type:complete
MLWVKAFHIIAIVCWFAGLFYLPRLYVYHAQADDQLSRDRFKVMERKLYRGITTPSMVATLLLGLWLMSFNPGYFMSQGWIHAKLTLVLILVGYHIYCGRLLAQFRDDRNTHGHVFYRWFNEFPVLILVGVVVLAIVKPF